jgi:hypothetical protein
MTSGKGSLIFSPPLGNQFSVLRRQQDKRIISMTLVAVAAAVPVPSHLPTMENTIPDHVNPQYTQVPPPVLQMSQELSEISMIDAFGRGLFLGRRQSSLNST